MEEKLSLLIKQIDSLASVCDNEGASAYDKVSFELNYLIIFIAGKESGEYKKFVEISRFNELRSRKVDWFRGLLGSLKSRLLIDGIKIQSNSNWDDLLNPIVYKTSFKKFSDEYYSEAVEAAIKELNVRAKNLYKKYKGKELDGSDLFANIFNSDGEKTLLIAGDDLDSQSGKDEQEGYRLLFMGLWKGIRNPKAHANVNLTKEQAIERLIFISMLMNKVDECIKKAGLIE